MNHSLISSTAVAVAVAAAAASPPISHKRIVNAAPTVSNYHKIVSSQPDQPQDCRQIVHRRRATTLGLAGLALGFISSDDRRRANAAGRRAPPPPPEEKKDPSMNAVTAKVLASKKRKEAMKESIARLKEKGKVITDQPSQ